MKVKFLILGVSILFCHSFFRLVQACPTPLCFIEGNCEEETCDETEE